MSKNLYQEEIIDPGDYASKFAKEIGFQSHNNCPAVIIVPHAKNNFRGAVGFTYKKGILKEMLKYKINAKEEIISWKMLQEVENDGAGGKPQFFTIIGTEEVFAGLGNEIIAMTADDFARSGRLPCVIDNELQAKRIHKDNLPLFKAMMKGYGEALKKANLVNITGEIAIMKNSITAFCDTNSNSQLIVTWGASCIGLSSQKLLLDPSKIKPGMVIVGFKENGYRCNGGGFHTELILREYGPEIGKIFQNSEALAYIKKLTVPSISYAKTVCRIIGWGEDGSVGEPIVKVHGIAHITGGGIWGKFGELLPKGIGAILDNMPIPPEVLLQAQEMSFAHPDIELSDKAAYSTFHGGPGMLLVVDDKKAAQKLCDEASNDGIEGEIIGSTDDSGVLKIVSRFQKTPGNVLFEVLK